MVQSYKKYSRITNENSLYRLITYIAKNKSCNFAVSKENKGSAQAVGVPEAT